MKGNSDSNSLVESSELKKSDSDNDEVNQVVMRNTVTVTDKMKKSKLPVGSSDFKKWIDEGYKFVDKSLFINEVINASDQAILMTAPRRFGKTINLSMLKYFLQAEVNNVGNIKSDEFKSHNKLFNKLNIGRGSYLDVKEIIERILLNDVSYMLGNEKARVFDICEEQKLCKDLIIKWRNNGDLIDNDTKVIKEQIAIYVKDLRGRFSSIEKLDDLIVSYQKTKVDVETAIKKKSRIADLQKHQDNERKAYNTLKTAIEGAVSDNDQLRESLKDYTLVGRNQGKYPVINLTFGNVGKATGNKGKLLDNKDTILNDIRREIAKAFKEHGYLINVLNLKKDNGSELEKFNAENDLKKLKAYYNGEKDVDLKDSLGFLSELLHKHYGKKAYILVDEYDRPSNALLAEVLKSEKGSNDYEQAKENYDTVSNSITSILCQVGKTHPEHMEKIIMMGIMDALKRDAGSGFNNVSTCSILDKRFSEYFGIIQDTNDHKHGELNEFLGDIGFEEKDIGYDKSNGSLVDGKLMDELKKAYNGYLVPILSGGKINVYTPYSLVKALEDLLQHAGAENSDDKIELKFGDYWDKSGQILDSIGLRNIKPELLDKLGRLSVGTEEDFNYERYIDLNKESFSVHQESSIASILIHHGYLTLSDNNDGKFKLPNTEVRHYFAKNVLEHWLKNRFHGDANELISAFFTSISANSTTLSEFFNDTIKKLKYVDNKEDDFKVLFNGLAMSAEVLNLKVPYLCRSEVEIDRKRIDGFFIPANDKISDVIIHEYGQTKKTGEKDALLEDKLWQICANKYMKKATDLCEHSYNQHWKNVVIRSVIFYCDKSQKKWSSEIKEGNFTIKQAKEMNKIFSTEYVENNRKILIGREKTSEKASYRSKFLESIKRYKASSLDDLFKKVAHSNILQDQVVSMNQSYNIQNNMLDFKKKGGEVNGSKLSVDVMKSMLASISYDKEKQDEIASYINRKFANIFGITKNEFVTQWNQDKSHPASIGKAGAKEIYDLLNNKPNANKMEIDDCEFIESSHNDDKSESFTLKNLTIKKDSEKVPRNAILGHKESRKLEGRKEDLNKHITNKRSYNIKKSPNNKKFSGIHLYDGMSKEDIEGNLDAMIASYSIRVDNYMRLDKSILNAEHVKDTVDGWIKFEFSNNYVALIALEEGNGGKHAILMHAIRQKEGGAKISLTDPLSFADFAFKSEFECLLDSLKYEVNVIYTGRQDKDYATCGDICLIIAQELLESHMYISRAKESYPQTIVDGSRVLFEGEDTDGLSYATEKASTFLLKFTEFNNEMSNLLALPDLIENVFGSSGHSKVAQETSYSILNALGSLFSGFEVEWHLKKLIYSEEMSRFRQIMEKHGINKPFDIIKNHSEFKYVLGSLHPDVKGGNAEDFIFAKNLEEKFSKGLSFRDILTEKAKTAQSALHNASAGFKALDTVVDVARLLQNPTSENAIKVGIDSAHLYGIYSGVNYYSGLISVSGILYNAYLGEYSKAFEQAITTAAYNALPSILWHFSLPIALIYGVSVTAHSGYSAVSNLYAFYLEYKAEIRILLRLRYTIVLLYQKEVS